MCMSKSLLFIVVCWLDTLVMSNIFIWLQKGWGYQIDSYYVCYAITPPVINAFDGSSLFSK